MANETYVGVGNGSTLLQHYDHILAPYIIRAMTYPGTSASGPSFGILQHWVMRVVITRRLERDAHNRKELWPKGENRDSCTSSSETDSEASSSSLLIGM